MYRARDCEYRTADSTHATDPRGGRSEFSMHDGTHASPGARLSSLRSCLEPALARAPVCSQCSQLMQNHCAHGHSYQRPQNDQTCASPQLATSHGCVHLKRRLALGLGRGRGRCKPDSRGVKRRCSDITPLIAADRHVPMQQSLMQQSLMQQSLMQQSLMQQLGMAPSPVRAW